MVLRHLNDLRTITSIPRVIAVMQIREGLAFIRGMAQLYLLTHKETIFLV